jgi:hypothetical protein
MLNEIPACGQWLDLMNMIVFLKLKSCSVFSGRLQPHQFLYKECGPMKSAKSVQTQWIKPTLQFINFTFCVFAQIEWQWHSRQNNKDTRLLCLEGFIKSISRTYHCNLQQVSTFKRKIIVSSFTTVVRREQEMKKGNIGRNKKTINMATQLLGLCKKYLTLYDVGKSRNVREFDLSPLKMKSVTSALSADHDFACAGSVTKRRIPHSNARQVEAYQSRIPHTVTHA